MKKALLIVTNLSVAAWHSDVHADTSGPLSVTAPEPETIVLLGIALVAFAVYGLYMRKKRKIK